MATINFPVPDGLLDLLRDFTVAVVQNQPDDLEKFAAEYFTRLAETDVDEGSVECSKTRSLLEFDESMYVTYVAEKVEEVESQLSSAVSPSHDSAVSGESGAKTPEPECPDEAARCWEKWTKDWEEPQATTAVDEDAAKEDGAASKERSAENTQKDSAVVDSTPAAEQQRDSTTLAQEEPGQNDSSVRDSTIAKE